MNKSGQNLSDGMKGRLVQRIRQHRRRQQKTNPVAGAADFMNSTKVIEYQ
jgi:hypothetical protein